MSVIVDRAIKGSTDGWICDSGLLTENPSKHAHWEL